MKSVSRLALTLACAAASSLVAAPMTFDFKDPKGVNAVQFHLDSLLEPISGTAGGVSGSVTFDPEKPAATRGTIAVATASVIVPNATMTEHLLGDGWLDAQAHPEITFKLASLESVQAEGTTTKAIAVGQFSLKGVTRDVRVPVTLTHLPGAFGKRINKPELKGDLLVIRGEFEIARADYGIKPGQNEDKVSPTIKLSLGIVGSAPAK